ncbi:hypothetical protein [Intrasporangium mesophilum]
MSIESRSQRHRPNPRRDLVVAAALAAFAVLTAVVVALWPGESWRDQAIAGVFPAPPVSGWDAPTSAAPSAAGAGSTAGAPTATATVVPARATPSVVPTRSAPRPAPPATSLRATSQAPATTPAPSPTSTNGKGRHKPKPPTGKPSPTTTQNDPGCLLGVIC